MPKPKKEKAPPREIEAGIPTGRFQIFRAARADSPIDLREAYEIVAADERAANLPEGRGGFFEPVLTDHHLGFTFREIAANEILELADGGFRRSTYYSVIEAHFAVLTNGFMLVWGNGDARKLGLFTFAKYTGIEAKSAAIAPRRLHAVSDHMTAIKSIDFDKMTHQVFKKVKLDGAIETMADIAPFEDYIDNIKSIRGVANTPDGVRTVSLKTDGSVSITKKKDEPLDLRVVYWLLRLVYAERPSTQAEEGEDPAPPAPGQDVADALARAVVGPAQDEVIQEAVSNFKAAFGSDVTVTLEGGGTSSTFTGTGAPGRV